MFDMDVNFRVWRRTGDARRGRGDHRMNHWDAQVNSSTTAQINPIPGVAIDGGGKSRLHARDRFEIQERRGARNAHGDADPSRATSDAEALMRVFDPILDPR
jgi:hypothetical protein